MARQRNDLVTLETAFKALGDTTRLRIAHLLDGRDVCVCHVHEALGLPQPKVSRHLAYLRRTGLVSTRREGRWIYYRLSPAGMSPLVQRILDATFETLSATTSCAHDRRRLDTATQCESKPAKPRLRRRAGR